MFSHKDQSNTNILKIFLIDGIQTGTTTQGQSGPESNGYEGVVCTLQISRTDVLPSDTVLSQTHDSTFFGVGGA